jgi:D-alanyl-D-alanine dipeptidase/CubicO group peptidase (beta-lactamase class C family)
VESRSLDLDVPVSKYLPDFAPGGTARTPLTLRHLMAHRSGLVREPPKGHYFDSSATTLEETVASLNGVPVVYAPGTRTKYSNAAIAVVGRVLEVQRGIPFARFMRDSVLAPLGMLESSFHPDSSLRSRVPEAEMWTLDGRSFAAPRFDLGMAPAGNLYSTVVDLGRFLAFIFSGGRSTDGGQFVRRSTLDSMMAPQFSRDSPYGIGFAISTLDAARRIGHNGGIYGFSTHVSALPDEKLGVVVVVTADDAGAVATRIGTEVLRSMLAARSGARAWSPVRTFPMDSALAVARAGRYESRRRNPAARSVELRVQGDSLVAHPVGSGRPEVLRRVSAVGVDTLVADGRLAYGRRYLFVGDLLISGTDTLRRAAPRKPLATPAALNEYIGEYGPDFNVQYVLEREGRLYLLVEWFDWYPLRRISADSFAFPNDGGYAGEAVKFERGAGGRIQGMKMGGIHFSRRTVGPQAGTQLRIAARMSPAEALARARTESPPAGDTSMAPDFVDIRSLEPGIRLDIRYASENNFLGFPFYSVSRAVLRRPAAEALAKVHRGLARRGYGLLVHDAYRPWFVTRAFWDATPDSVRWLVADPATGSRHNRGAAVDLTLYVLSTGRPVAMPGTYDETTPRSRPGYPGGTELQRWHRELLRTSMEAAGFRVNPSEWWHFDYLDGREWPLGNTPLESIER